MTDMISPEICKTIVNALPDAALVVNKRREIIAANARANEELDVVSEGQPVALFLRSPDVLAALSDTLEHAAFRRVELVMYAKVPRTLDVLLSPLGRDHSGALALLLLLDRTREAQVERMRSDFVANASHELRTPLTTLSGFIETMQGAARQDENARREFLKVMKAQADRMSLLIDDLLSLSRIELDEHVAPGAKVNLTEIVRQTQNMLQSFVKDRACELVVNMPGELLVMGDPNQLGQVIHNLVENAVKYSGSGKRVVITGKADADMAILSVEDNGPGIAAYHIPRLTERFYRVNVQDSLTRGGTGLGLAICKHIINRHRGRLVIESDVGTGSKFLVHLPLYR